MTTKRIKATPKALSVWLEILLHAGYIDSHRAPESIQEAITKLVKSGLIHADSRIGGPPPGAPMPVWSFKKDRNTQKTLEMLWLRVRRDPKFDLDILMKPMMNHDAAPSRQAIEHHHQALLSRGDDLPAKVRALFTEGGTHECDVSKRLRLNMNSKGCSSTWYKKGKPYILEQGSDAGIMQQLIIEDHGNDDWHYPDTVAVVENMDIALYPDTYLHNISFQGPVLYFGTGTLSKNALNWLKDKRRGSQILMMVDYDVAGLLTYLKAREILGDKVKLYIPDNLPQLFERYGSKNLFRQQLSLDITPILRSDNMAVRGVFSLIRKHKRSLEQEALIQSYDAAVSVTDDAAPSWEEVERRAGRVEKGEEGLAQLSVINGP